MGTELVSKFRVAGSAYTPTFFVILEEEAYYPMQCNFEP